MALDPNFPLEQQASPEVAFTERQLREAALACFANAQEFYEEACLLLQHNHVRSIALAILGAEEFAKAIVFTVAAFRPDEHALLAKALFREKKTPELFHHQVKHLVADQIEGTLIGVEDGIDGEEWASGFSTDASGRLNARLLALANDGLKKLIPTATEATAQANALNEIKYGAAPNTLKNLAFYVGIDHQGNIATPSQLREDQARDEILGLEYFLENFALLPEILQNDERWQVLTRSIHQ